MPYHCPLTTGGGGAPLIYVRVICDPLHSAPLRSFYPHEAESLLLPGTRLRVVSRKRVGNVAEIHVEEVDSE